MIYEYALEPEMVSAWGRLHNQRFFLREFGLGQGRLVSRYPKKWARKVWESFGGDNDMDKKRLEELLVRLQETMIKRKDCVWDDAQETWIENALLEHVRHPSIQGDPGQKQPGEPTRNSWRGCSCGLTLP